MTDFGPKVEHEGLLRADWKPMHRRRPVWPWILLALVLLVGILLCFGAIAFSGRDRAPADRKVSRGGLATSGVPASEAPTGQLRIDSCNAKTFAGQTLVEIRLTVTNNTGKPKTFMPVVDVLDPSGARLAQAYAVIDDVAPGQTASTDTATGIPETREKVTCVVHQ